MVSGVFGEFGYMICEERGNSGIVHPGEGKAEGGSGGMWYLIDEGV